MIPDQEEQCSEKPAGTDQQEMPVIDYSGQVMKEDHNLGGRSLWVDTECHWARAKPLK